MGSTLCKSVSPRRQDRRQAASGNIRYHPLIGGLVLSLEATEDHTLQLSDVVWFLQESPNFVNGCPSGLLAGVSVHTRAQRRESNALHSILDGQLQTATVAAPEQRLLTVAALGLLDKIDGANSMDDLLAWQTVRVRDLGVTCAAAVESATFTEQIRASGTVDGAINASTTEKGLVGRVDDAINL